MILIGFAHWCWMVEMKLFNEMIQNMMWLKSFFRMNSYMSSSLFKLYETSFSINFVKKKIRKLDFMCLLMNHAYFIRTPRNTVDADHEF